MRSCWPAWLKNKGGQSVSPRAKEREREREREEERERQTERRDSPGMRPRFAEAAPMFAKIGRMMEAVATLETSSVANVTVRVMRSGKTNLPTWFFIHSTSVLMKVIRPLFSIPRLSANPPPKRKTTPQETPRKADISRIFPLPFFSWPGAEAAPEEKASFEEGRDERRGVSEVRMGRREDRRERGLTP